MQKTSVDFNSLPILSAEKFADAVGLPIGVVEAQMDRRLLPVSRIGKRRFVNLELLRKKCISEGS